MKSSPSPSTISTQRQACEDAHRFDMENWAPRLSWTEWTCAILGGVTLGAIGFGLLYAIFLL